MDNVQFFTDTDAVTGKVTETVLIDRGNGEFTSMPKAIYDTLVSNSNTPKEGI